MDFFDFLTPLSTDQLEYVGECVRRIIDSRAPKADELDVNLSLSNFCHQKNCPCVYRASGVNDVALKDVSNILHDQLFIANPEWKNDDMTHREIVGQLTTFLKSEKVSEKSSVTFFAHKKYLYHRDGWFFCLLTCTSHLAAARIQASLAKVHPEWQVNFNRVNRRKKSDSESLEENERD